MDGDNQVTGGRSAPVAEIKNRDGKTFVCPIDPAELDQCEACQ